jgi:two-component system NtrC family response regulator
MDPIKPRLLIVDDDEEIRSQMKWALTGDYNLSFADDRAHAIEAFREQRPAVALLDLGLPPHPANPQEGLAALAEILAEEPRTKVVIVTGQSEKANALQAIGAGAYDYLGKPVDVDELKVVLRRAFHLASLEREYERLQHEYKADTFEGMLGGSPQMQDVFTTIRKVSTTNAPVLVLGDSGTGKEMVASAIHRLSSRKTGTFVAINCGAIPETLLESELFGHERGAFTGAHVQRKGRIETAHGGTLFLDEIGELPMLLQVKLLRFLQEQTIERIGGRQPIQVDSRIIAATNVDLKKAMTEGAFREDLFYRLAVVVIKLPPLRERENDIKILAQSFLRRAAHENDRRGLSFEPEALKALSRYSWPGNVRELENRIKRAVIMCDQKRVSVRDLELNEVVSTTPSGLKEAREAVERELVTKTLRKHSGKIAPAAAELGISRPTMYELMEKLGLKKEQVP